jgi:hypothetical protein
MKFEDRPSVRQFVSSWTFIHFLAKAATTTSDDHSFEAILEERRYAGVERISGSLGWIGIEERASEDASRAF